MPDRDTLLSMAERCEKATENDADLFADAFQACFPRPQRIWVTDNTGPWTEEYSAWQARQSRFWGLIEAEAWLDSAMTLVPEGVSDELLNIDLRRANLGSGIVRYHAVLTDTLNGDFWKRTAPSFALALCAAALRSRAALITRDRG